MELRSYMGLEEAIERGAKYEPSVVHESVPLLEAVGKYSMESIKSPSDFPKYDKSAMDGYAINSKETISASRNNPATFTLIGELFPSSEHKIKLEKGEAIKVMTGAKIPDGADSVAMLEDALEDGGELRVFSPVRKLQNVGRRGEDMKKNLTILGKGEMITPPHISALTECEIGRVKVCSLSIGIVSTGDEIVSGKITNSTQPLLQSFFERRGFTVKGYGAVGDDEGKIEKALKKVTESIIIVTGGTGPGEKDLLPSVIEKNGNFVFRGLRIRPGRTTSFGSFKGKPIFMLSGLPVAALIASENVVLRILESWFTLAPPRKEYREGVLQRSVVNTLGFRSFVRVKIKEQAELTRIIPTRITGSGVIYSIIDADAILTVDENSEGLEEGEAVRVEMLRW